MLLGNTVFGLHEVRCPVSASAEHQERATIHDFPDGSRAATLYGTPSGAREWSVGYGALRPGDVEFLSSMATQRGWYDNGQLAFVPPGGEHVNLLTREEAALSGLPGFTPMPVTTTDGPAFGSVTLSAVTVVGQGIPLPQAGTERRLRVSAYCSGTVSVGVKYLSGYGGQVGSYGFDLNAADYTRASVVFPDVEKATSVTITLKGSFTRPAVTVGEDLWAWGEGQRVPSVIVAQKSNEIQWAPSLNAQTATYSKAAFTITELREGA